MFSATSVIVLRVHQSIIALNVPTLLTLMQELLVIFAQQAAVFALLTEFALTAPLLAPFLTVSDSASAAPSTTALNVQ